MHGTYLKKTLQILTYVFNWLYFTQCLTSFSSIHHLLQLCAWFLILFHVTSMRFSQSTHLLMFFSSKTLTSIIRTGLPILVELIHLANSVIIANDLTQLVNFPTQILDCDSHSPTLLDLLISSDTSVCSTMVFPPLGNSFSIKFTKGSPISSHSL